MPTSANTDRLPVPDVLSRVAELRQQGDTTIASITSQCAGSLQEVLARAPAAPATSADQATALDAAQVNVRSVLTSIITLDQQTQDQKTQLEQVQKKDERETARAPKYHEKLRALEGKLFSWSPK